MNFINGRKDLDSADHKKIRLFQRKKYIEGVFGVEVDKLKIPTKRPYEAHFLVLVQDSAAFLVKN